jgi:hypothetical protein
MMTGTVDRHLGNKKIKRDDDIFSSGPVRSVFFFLFLLLVIYRTLERSK